MHLVRARTPMHKYSHACMTSLGRMQVQVHTWIALSCTAFIHIHNTCTWHTHHVRIRTHHMCICTHTQRKAYIQSQAHTSAHTHITYTHTYS